MKAWPLIFLLGACAGARTIEVAADGAVRLDGQADTTAGISRTWAGSRPPVLRADPETPWAEVERVLRACVDEGVMRVEWDGRPLALHRTLSDEWVVLSVVIRPGPEYKLGRKNTSELPELEAWLADRRRFSRRYAHPLLGEIAAERDVDFGTVAAVIDTMRAADLPWVSVRIR